MEARPHDPGVCIALARALKIQMLSLRETHSEEAAGAGMGAGAGGGGGCKITRATLLMALLRRLLIPVLK